MGTIPLRSDQDQVTMKKRTAVIPAVLFRVVESTKQRVIDKGNELAYTNLIEITLY